MRSLQIPFLLLLVVAMVLPACASEEMEPLPPDQYLDAAVSWIETHAVNGHDLDWDEVRDEAGRLAVGATTTAETYPAIRYVINSLEGGIRYFRDPAEMNEPRAFGLKITYPEGFVVDVDADSPAAQAGLQIGDVVESLNGRPLSPQFNWEQLSDLDPYVAVGSVELVVRRDGAAGPMSITLEPERFDFAAEPVGRRLQLASGAAGYVDLNTDVGTREYPTAVQKIMADADGPELCGWIIDLRRTTGGDLWSYLAALGPVLGQGEVGGFVYPDGRDDGWFYRDDKVYWASEERFESYVRGAVFEPQRPDLPVALLTSPLTIEAAENMIVAFHSRDDVRTFGQTTAGRPHLNIHTPLSDGAEIFVSGALARDLNGEVYDGPIEPDEVVITDWTRFGAADDPVILAASNWLAAQPACNQ